MKFVIPRNKWIKGSLIDENGCSCVIGHCLLQLGYELEDLISSVAPEELDPPPDVFTYRQEGFGAVDFVWVDRAISINDSDAPGVAREIALSGLFSDNGHELEFVDE